MRVLNAYQAQKMLIKKVNNESEKGKKESWKNVVYLFLAFSFVCKSFLHKLSVAYIIIASRGYYPFFPSLVVTHPLSTVLPYTIPPSSAVYLFCPEAFMHVQEQFQSSFYYEKSEKERGQNNEKQGRKMGGIFSLIQVQDE